MDIVPRTKATDKPKEKSKAKAKDSRGNKPLKQIESILKVSEIYCLCCGEKKDIDVYYTSDSLQYRAYGRIPYCKDCIDKMYQGYLDEFNRLQYTNCEKRAVQRLCMVLDLYYSDEMYNTAFSDHQKAVVKFDNKDLKFITYYMKNVKMYQYRKRNYNTTINDEYKTLKEENRKMSIFNNVDSKDQERINKAVKIFGAGFSDVDYLFLLDQYDDWTSRHECKTKSQEEIFKAICFNRLKAHKANVAGEDTKDLDRTFKDLLDTGKLQPKQNKESIIADKMRMGDLISMWENVIKKPVPTPTSHLADIDHIGELDGFMRGHTITAIGESPNSYSEVYKKLMKQFTVNRPEYTDDYDSDDAFDKVVGESLDKILSNDGGVSDG